MMGISLAAMTLGAATYDASTGYVTQTPNVQGSTSNDSPLNYQTANDSGGKPFWSDGQAIHAGTNYYMSSWGRTPYGGKIKEDGTNVLNIVVPANKVVLQGGFNLKTITPYRLTFANEGLFCLGGSYWLINDNNLNPFIVDGLVTLQGTSTSRRFRLHPFNSTSGQTLQIDAKLKTTASTDYLVVTKNSKYFGTVKLAGDTTEFAGTVDISSNRLCLANFGLANETANVVLSENAELTLDATNGTTVVVNELRLNSRSRIVIPATNNLQIRSFTPQTGTTLSFEIGPETNGTISVDSITLPASGTIAIERTGNIGINDMTNNVTRRVLMRAPAGTLDATRFTLVNEHLVGAAPTFTLAVETEGDEDLLLLTCTPVVLQVVSIGSASTAGLFNQATTWSNGKTPDQNEGLDFYSSSGTPIYFPNKNSEKWTFPGRSFTKDGGTLTFQGAKETTFNSFAVKAGTTMRAWSGGTSVYVGPLTYFGGTIQSRFTMGNQSVLEWRGPISGEVQIRPAIRQFGADKSDWAPCYLYPSGDNSAFTGTWRVETESYGDGGKAEGHVFTSFEDYYLGLIISEQKNLGGPLPTFTYHALTLCPWQALVARTNATSAAATVTLDDVTRGVNIIGTAKVFVDEGQTLAVKVPVTIAGTLKKRGTGTLGLGGTASPRFCQSKQWTAEQVATANLVDTNVLWVAEGGLKPLTKEGTDGLAIKVGPEGALKLDLVPTGDAATYGLYNTAWAKPLVAVDAEGAEDASAKINVAFDLPATGIEAKSYMVPVCTVSTAAAAALRGTFAFRSPAKNYSVRVAEVADTASDTVTFVATVGPSGLTIIVR